MSITVANTTFHRVAYDREGDVLYLSLNDPPQPAVRTVTMPDRGGAVRYDERGRMIGLTILHARLRLERDGELILRLPQPEAHISASELEPALG